MKTNLLNGRARLSRAVTFLFAFLVLFSGQLLCPAQVQQAWVAKYNNGILNGTNQAVKMVLDGTGNIYVTGFSQNATNGNLDYATIKYAPNGNQIWAARYAATNTTIAQPTGLVLDSNTNVIITGTACTVKYDQNANQLWTAPYTGNSAVVAGTPYYAGNPVAVDNSNNVFVTGFSTNFALIKMDSGGSNVWETTYPSPYASGFSPYGAAVGQSLCTDSNGNIYVAGGYKFYNSPYPYYELLALKYASNGVQLWVADARDSQFGSPDVQGACLDRAGNFYVLWNAGEPYHTTQFANSNGSIVWSGTDPTDDLFSASRGLTLDYVGNAWITGSYAYYYPKTQYGTYKLSTKGIYTVTNLYPTISGPVSVATAIAVDQANSAYVTGYSPSTSSSNDIVTIKCDSKGNQIWLQRYNGPGNGDDEGNAIAVDALGNVYVTGYDTTASGGTEMVTIKYAPTAMIQKQGNGSFLLQEQGEPGEAFDFQVSTNLQTWLDLGTTNADTNGFVQFLDTNATNFPQRFYLLVPQ
jgi:Beta-propeller repeat